MQSKLESWLEVFTNTAIGYTISLFAQWLIFPLFNLSVTVSDNLLICACFTVLSVLRSYCVRRWFNKKRKFNV